MMWYEECDTQNHKKVNLVIYTVLRRLNVTGHQMLVSYRIQLHIHSSKSQEFASPLYNVVIADWVIDMGTNVIALFLKLF